MTRPDDQKSLKPAELALLREVIASRAPDRMSLLAKAETGALDEGERRHLCELIGAEFAATGVDSDSEPLPRGLELEALLDVVNRPNLKQGRRS